jgi:DNA-binding transcriptional regulator PaaX
MLHRVRKRLHAILRHKSYGALAHSILMTLAITGMLSVAVIAPNTFRAVEAVGMRKKTYTLPYIRAVLHRLILGGYVAEVMKDGQAYFTLTPEGQKRLSIVNKRPPEIPKKKSKRNGAISTGVRYKR